MKKQNSARNSGTRRYRKHLNSIDKNMQEPRPANERKNISQPSDWWDAWKSEADKDGVSLSKWIGEQCNAALTAKSAKGLTERPPAHRPKSKDDKSH